MEDNLFNDFALSNGSDYCKGLIRTTKIQEK
jgi:hypothetical protein